MHEKKKKKKMLCYADDGIGIASKAWRVFYVTISKFHLFYLFTYSIILMLFNA